MDVNSLLDEARKVCRASSDKELAPHLGVKPSAVSNYRKGVSHPNPVVCATLAGLTGVPLVRVLGIIGEARAISREEKAVWRKVALSACIALCAIGISYNPAVAKAETGASSPALSIMSNARGAIRYYWQLLLIALGGIIKRRSKELACNT